MAERGRRFRTSRKDGLFMATAGFVHDLTKRAEPGLAFDPAMSRRDFAVWRRRVRSKLCELLAMPEGAEPSPPKLISTRRRRGYALQRWEFYPEPRCVLPALVLVPDSATTSSPAPGVLCLPGTDYSKELMAGEREGKRPLARYHRPPPKPAKQRMGWHYARAGFVAVCVDNPGTQETASDVCPGRSEFCAQLLALGRNYIGLCTHHGRVLFDWLRAQPFVDSGRIAASGHSLGTNAALALAVLEPSIAAVVNNGSLGDHREGVIATGLLASPIWHLVPGMDRWFGRPDLAASLAPRPLLVCEGASPTALAKIGAAYELAGHADRFTVAFSPKYEGTRRAPSPPPEGLTKEALKKHARLDSSFHYFHPDIAVPWLTETIDGLSHS